MAKLFIFAASSAVSKAGKPYTFQQVQIVQGPARPDAFDRIFVQDGQPPFEPGAYTGEIYVRATPQGNRVAIDTATLQKAK